MILWHLLFKKSLYEAIEKIPTDEAKISTEYELIKSPLRIDAVIEVRDTLKLNLLVPIFSYGKRVNIVEYKSIWETFTANFYRKTIGYGFFYAFQNDISEEEIAEFIFVSKLDRKLFDKYNFTYVGNGIYKRNWDLLTYIILINELEIREENYPFLRFSSGETFEKYLHNVVSKGNFVEIKFCYIIHPDRVKEVMNMQGIEIPIEQLTVLDALRRIGLKNALPPNEMKELMREYGLKDLVDAIGIKTVVEEFGINAVIKEIGIEAVIKEIGIEAVIKEIGIEAVIKEIGIETVIKEIGIETVIKEIGTDAVIKKIGIETFIRNIGIERLKKEIERMENDIKK
jgi:hypothetical protein